MLLLSFSMQAEIISVKTMFLYAGWKDQCEFILFWMRTTMIRKQWISWTLYIFISFLEVQTVFFTAIYVHLLSRIIGSCVYIISCEQVICLFHFYNQYNFLCLLKFICGLCDSAMSHVPLKIPCQHYVPICKCIIIFFFLNHALRAMCS